MSDPLAIRIEAALTDWQRLATDAGSDAAYADGWLLPGDFDVMGFIDGDPEFMAAMSPAVVLGLIAGMRQIAKLHIGFDTEQAGGRLSCRECGPFDDVAWRIDGDYGWPCPTILTLSSMLGIETNEETHD